MDSLASFYYREALLAEREGNFSGAIGLFRICRTLEGYDQGDLCFHIGWCIEQRDGISSEEALACYRAAGEDAFDPACRVNGFFRAGWLLLHRKVLPDAELMFRKAVEEGDAFDAAEEPYRHASYWLGVCLEAQGRYVEAITRFRLVKSISSLLEPEATYRELRCLVSIGRYVDACGVCEMYPEKPPPGFDSARYKTLASLVRKEKQELLHCLDEPFFPAVVRMDDVC